MTAQKFDSKPVTIEAWQFDGTHMVGEGIVRWARGHGADVYLHEIVGGEILLHILTLEGEMTAMPGDWIIRGLVDEFYPCKPDVFERKYEPHHG